MFHQILFSPYFDERPIPDWVMSSPLLEKHHSLPLFHLNLVNRVGRIRIGPIELEIESKKLTAEEFRRLVDEVAGFLSRLPFSHKGAGLSFELLDKVDVPIAYHTLVYQHLLVQGSCMVQSCKLWLSPRQFCQGAAVYEGRTCPSS